MVDELAKKVERAAEANDSMTVYKVVRSLIGSPPAPLAALEAKDGTLLTSKADIEERWEQHHVEVLNGRVVEDLDADYPPVSPKHEVGGFDPSVADIEELLKHINGNKGLGKDQISATLLKAGGFTIAMHLSQFVTWAVRAERVPLPWRGGRVVNLFKGKGSSTKADNFRGLLVSDHAGKVLTGALQKEITPAYQRFVGYDQYGGVPGLGTAQASHAVRSFLDATKMLKLSSAVLFLDLVKAFDKAIRELVMGPMQGTSFGNEEAAMRDIGLPAETVTSILRVLLEEGPVLERLGLDKKAAELIKSLHTGAWMQTSGRDGHIVSTTGGRQGCKLGAVVFNLAYAVALVKVKEAVATTGATLVISNLARDTFWKGGASAQPAAWEKDSLDSHGVHEVTYVDDEGFLIAAQTPRILVAAVHALLEALCQTFRAFGLIINFGPGKTEIMVQLRGRNAAVTKQELKNAGGFQLPQTAGAQLLRIVSSYKHLGCMLADDGVTHVDVVRRVNAANSAYAPIAMKVLGRQTLARLQRIRLASALVFSRLFYNTAVWSSISTWSLGKLNAMYMRVLRRILGATRFDDTCAMTDLQVRTLIGMPAIECYISRLRLSYFASMLTSPAFTLRALLAITAPDGSRLPWWSLLVADLQLLHDTFPRRFAELGRPQRDTAWLESQDASQWCSFIEAFPHQFRESVKQLVVHESVLDTHVGPLNAPECTSHGAHVCATCGKSFASKRARDMHGRKKHAERSPFASLIGDTCQCPICATTFSTRLRLLAHLAETRVRGKKSRPCGPQLLDRNPTQIPVHERDALNALDTTARREAKRVGYMHPRSTAMPVRAKRLTKPQMPAATPCKRKAKELSVPPTEKRHRAPSSPSDECTRNAKRPAPSNMDSAKRTRCTVRVPGPTAAKRMACTEVARTRKAARSSKDT